MMKLEILSPLAIRVHPDPTVRTLGPGVVELPDDQAEKLLAKAPGKVRAVTPGDSTLTPGQPVEWDSPLFGLLRGVLIEPVGAAFVRVWHPLTDREAVIPRSWLQEACP